MTVSKAKCIRLLNKKTVKETDDLLDKIPQILDNISKTLSTLFPHASALDAEKSFETALKPTNFTAPNEAVEKIVSTTREYIFQIISDLFTLERFIALHVPAMEDGNNFGVSVQMTIAKFLEDTRAEFETKFDAITKYYSSRAEAVDKLNVSDRKKSESTTKTSTDAKGGKDGDSNSTSVVVVSKEETNENLSKNDLYRVKHLLSIDVQCYMEMNFLCIKVMDGYATILDNMEKNSQKLKSPKGDSGGNSMSMY